MADADEAWTLVERVQAGDKRAYEELYQRYKNLVYRFIFRRVQSKDDAEDIMQQVFLKGYLKIASLTHHASSVEAWFVTIARRTVIDHYRHVVATQRELPIDHFFDLDRADTGYVGDSVSVTALAVRVAMKELPPDELACLLLRYFYDLTQDETGRLLGKANRTVIIKTQRIALERMRELLELDSIES